MILRKLQQTASLLAARHTAIVLRHCLSTTSALAVGRPSRRSIRGSPAASEAQPQRPEPQSKQRQAFRFQVRPQGGGGAPPPEPAAPPSQQAPQPAAQSQPVQRRLSRLPPRPEPPAAPPPLPAAPAAHYSFSRVQLSAAVRTAPRGWVKALADNARRSGLAPAGGPLGQAAQAALEAIVSRVEQAQEPDAPRRPAPAMLDLALHRLLLNLLDHNRPVQLKTAPLTFIADKLLDTCLQLQMAHNTDQPRPQVAAADSDAPLDGAQVQRLDTADKLTLSAELGAASTTTENVADEDLDGDEQPAAPPPAIRFYDTDRIMARALVRLGEDYTDSFTNTTTLTKLAAPSLLESVPDSWQQALQDLTLLSEPVEKELEAEYKVQAEYERAERRYQQALAAVEAAKRREERLAALKAASLEITPLSMRATPAVTAVAPGTESPDAALELMAQVEAERQALNEIDPIFEKITDEINIRHLAEDRRRERRERRLAELADMPREIPFELGRMPGLHRQEEDRWQNSVRHQRVSQALYKTLQQIVLTDSMVPEFQQGSAAIEGVEMKANLRSAKVYWRADSETLARKMEQAFRNHGAAIRFELARQLNMKYTPVLHFERSRAAKRASNVNNLFAAMQKEIRAFEQKHGPVEVPDSGIWKSGPK